MGRSRPAQRLGTRAEASRGHLSSDAYNRSELRTVIVAIVTTNPRLAALPGNVAMPADITGLPIDSVVNVTQIATIDRLATQERTGALPDWLIAQIDTGLARALGLHRASPA